MLVHFKRIVFFSLAVFFTFSLSAQDTVVYGETDSLQDIQLKKMEQQIGALNYSIRKNNREQKNVTDSLMLINDKQAARIILLTEKSEILKRELIETSELIGDTDKKLNESKRKISLLFFISGPLLLLLIITVSTILYLMIVRNRKSSEIHINALRKYTLQGMEEVREDYIKEIKRRAKKLTVKLKGSGKKGKRKKH